MGRKMGVDVDAIGGSLSVTSFPGEGTGVDVVIPFDDDPAATAEEPGAIGSVLNMHWAPPASRNDKKDVNEETEDGQDFPHAVGQ